MLFTRTLRRKLMFGVGLVLGMLLILSVSGILGLNSYRTVVREFDDGINAAPQRTELLEAIVELNDLAQRKSTADAEVTLLQEQFRKRLAMFQVTVDEYRLRREKLLPIADPNGQRPLTDASLSTIDDGRQQLQSLVEALTDKDSRAQTWSRMNKQVHRMLIAARWMPDPVEGLKGSINRAKDDYRASLVAVWVTSSIAVILFLGLLRYGYIWIFHPIRQLHQGALRVAHGDFDYRVQLKTRDEMAELAAAFNEMTARFQEIAANLDAQVQERSQQLVRSERLAGVGFLAAGVAHEINNPLSAIAMAAESMESRVAEMLDRLDPGEADIIRRYLAMIQSESFRCKQITEIGRAHV